MVAGFNRDIAILAYLAHISEQFPAGHIADADSLLRREQQS